MHMDHMWQVCQVKCRKLHSLCPTLLLNAILRKLSHLRARICPGSDVVPRLSQIRKILIWIYQACSFGFLLLFKNWGLFQLGMKQSDSHIHQNVCAPCAYRHHVPHIPPLLIPKPFSLYSKLGYYHLEARYIRPGGCSAARDAPVRTMKCI